VCVCVCERERERERVDLAIQSQRLDSQEISVTG
jgi:hypothetical protein